jgi:hypothetical protein
VGAGGHFAECLALFDALKCTKALVPGNHDIWVEDDDQRGDSLRVYHDHLPTLCREHDFHYLDDAPLLLLDSGLALVGNINWYDYSWSIDALRQQLPDWEYRLRAKVFNRGRHNDARFVRWPLNDEQFTSQVVANLERQLREALSQADRAILVTHHPPFRGLCFPRLGPPTIDGLLWEAFSGNRSLEEILARHAERIPFAFCGHTHRDRENLYNNIRGYNIGGDYHFKRLLLLDWPVGTVEAHVFGDPDLHGP